MMAHIEAQIRTMGKAHSGNRLKSKNTEAEKNRLNKTEKLHLNDFIKSYTSTGLSVQEKNVKLQKKLQLFFS